jgi:Ca-activated chloride channel family protein
MRNKMAFGWLIIVTVFLAILMTGNLAGAAQFTADLVITGPGEDYTFKLYVKDNMYRLEKVRGAMKFPPFPTIVNRDTGLTWGLNPQMRQYVEMKDIERTFMMNPLVGWAMTRKGMTEKPGPVETVNGYECETRLYAMPGKSETAAKVWISKKLNHLIREERFGANENPVLELQNIQEGPVNESIFKIPEGYSKMSPGGPGAPPGAKKATAAAPGSAVKSGVSQRKSAPQPKGMAKGPVSGSSSAGNLMFILDASGSMWGQVEGKAKIAIAKEVLTGLIKDLPDDAAVGLVAYGHRRKGDCNDVEELVPLIPIDKGKLIQNIQALSPKGKTPITLSVRKTAEKIKHLEDETTIILVSDGKETCEGDPCALVKELKEAGIKFVMHVIGFDVTEQERAQLECMAKAGGGEYFTAKTAKDFQMAAKEVVKKAAEKPPISLKVTSIKDGKPFKTYVQVLTQGGEKRIAEGWTSAEKPATFRLPPGIYDICAQDQSVIQKPTVDIKNVEIVEDQTTEKIANFASEGILQVKAIKKNAPYKAQVWVYSQDNKQRGNSWTSADGKPAEFKLMPGIYRIQVQDPVPAQRPTIEINDVEVVAGQVVERVATFGQGGILHVKAVKNNAPTKTYVKVYRQEDDKYMGDNWTREDGKPAEYKLLPGIYKIYLQDPSVKQRPETWIENVEIKADQTVERFATFVAGGVLKVTATKNGAPYKAYVKIYQQNDDKYMGDGWSSADGKAAEYKLLPGSYYAKVQDPTDRSVREIRDIQLQSGKMPTVNASFPVEKEPPAVSRTQEQSAPTAEKPSAEAPAASESEGPMPEGKDTIMGGAVPIYNDAMVKNSMNMGNGTIVEMESSDSPAEIVYFYKKAMTEKGWSVVMEMARDKRATLMLKKDNQQLMLGAKERGGKTRFSLTLVKK